MQADTNFIFFILVLLFSVVIHEVSHGFMAYILGDTTAKRAGRLTLNPIPHIDPIGSILVPLLTYFASGGTLPFGWAKPVPYNPHNLRDQRWGETKVAFAGPASNLVLAFIFGMVVRFGSFSLNPQIVTILVTIIVVNLSLAVVNLIPLYPLDGSRIFFSVLPYHLRYIQEFMMRYMFVFLAFFLLFMGGIISFFVEALFHLFTNL